MIYLAQPYSHPDPAVRQARYEAGCKAAAHLMRQGHHVYAPIPASHGIALAGELPTDWGYWMAHCRIMVKMCHEVYVLTIEGWQESTGVMAEIEIAKEDQMPISYLNPDDYSIRVSSYLIALNA